VRRFSHHRRYTGVLTSPPLGSGTKLGVWTVIEEEAAVNAVTEERQGGKLLVSNTPEFYVTAPKKKLECGTKWGDTRLPVLNKWVDMEIKECRGLDEDCRGDDTEIIWMKIVEVMIQR
jgi:hypothetical protein